MLVGFCEEVLFRGILLRSLSNGTRAEAWCVLWSSVIFGLFHLSNVIYVCPIREYPRSGRARRNQRRHLV